MTRITIPLFVFILLLPMVAYAQNKPGLEFHVKRAIDPIVVDGQMNEGDWLKGSVANGFFMNSPIDSIAPQNKTEVRMTFDDQNFYILFTCFDSDSDMIIQSMKRDFDFRPNDNVGIYFDPYDHFCAIQQSCGKCEFEYKIPMAI